MTPPLRPFPAHPDGVAWPTGSWEESDLPPEVDAGKVAAILDRVLGPDQDPAVGHTNAVAVVHRGRIVAERYGEREMGPLAELAGVEPGPITAEDALHSWSMAKSVTQALVGLRVRDGALALDARADVPEWSGADDPRRVITLRQLLHMTSGIANADRDGGDGDVGRGFGSKMLFGEGARDMATQKWPDRIWIVRHGQSAGNVARDAAEAAGHHWIDIATRDMDTPLSELGERQALALGAWFAQQAPEARPSVFLSSPYVPGSR